MLELADIHHYFEQLFVREKFSPVVGNNNTRIVATILYPVTSTSIIIRGEAGSGKSTIVKGLASLAWGPEVLDDDIPNVVVLGGTSDKGLLTEDVVNRITTEATHCIIPELEFVVGKPHNEDILKLWTEGESYNYQRAVQFGRKSEKLRLEPLPILTSLANENARLKDLGEEMERRFMPFYTESSRQMTTEIHERKADIEALPDSCLYKIGGNRLRELREHIVNIIELGFDTLSGPKIKNPCAPFMQHMIPKRFTISNTYIGYWHKLVRGVTAFYHEDRFTYVNNGNTTVFSSPADNFLAWSLGGEAVVYASLRLRDMGKILMDAVPQLDYCYDGDMAVSADAKQLDEIVDEMYGMGYERPKSQIKELMMKLEWAGYIKSDGNGRYWKTMDWSDEFRIGVDWEKCIEATKELMLEYYPQIAKEYNALYCEDPRCSSPVPTSEREAGYEISILDLDAPVEETAKKPRAKLVDLMKLVEM